MKTISTIYRQDFSLRNHEVYINQNETREFYCHDLFFIQFYHTKQLKQRCIHPHKVLFI